MAAKHRLATARRVRAEQPAKAVLEVKVCKEAKARRAIRRQDRADKVVTAEMQPMAVEVGLEAPVVPVEEEPEGPSSL